jgi:hypothetical protein
MTANKNMLEDLQTGALAAKLLQLQKENRYLRKLTDNRGPGRIIRRAYDDALTLIAWRFSGFSITRKWCNENGMSERRWTWAIGLLKLARIYDNGDIAIDDIERCQRILKLRYDELMDEERGLDRLRMKMPRRYMNR